MPNIDLTPDEIHFMKASCQVFIDTYPKSRASRQPSGPHYLEVAARLLLRLQELKPTS